MCIFLMNNCEKLCSEKLDQKTPRRTFFLHFELLCCFEFSFGTFSFKYRLPLFDAFS